MKLLDVFALSGLINCIFVLALGIFIISHNWREKINRLYFLIVVAISTWSFSYWLWLSSNDAVSALFWVRMLSIGSTFIPIFYFHWVTSILKIEKRERNTRWLVYILGVLFILFSFSDLFVKGVEPKLFFPFWPDPGILYHFYLFVLYICLIIYSSNLLIKSYKIAEGEEKKRLTYVIAGAVLAFLGGLSNFFLWYNIPIAPYGNFLVAFYPVLFGYATIRYRLFNIKTIATEFFAITIWIFLFVKILLSVSFNDLIVNIILFVAVVFFGILLIRSVFKEVRQKEQIEKMAEDVKRAYEVEKKANEELEKLDKYKNDFLMQTQHDLKNPLTVIMGYSDILLNGKFVKVPKKAIDIIKRIQVVTQDKIKDVNNFLDTEQFKMGKGVILLKPGVELLPILEEIIGKLENKVESKGIYLKLEKPPSSAKASMGEAKKVLISADLEKLKSALFNVIDNSVKYTEKGGVTITINPKSETRNPKQIPNSNDQNSEPVVTIEVRDTGIGIPQDKIKNIFGMQFERTKQAQKTAEGSGVGLRLASQIIKLHNGKIWAESGGMGKGSTFYIELPIGL
ncbi:MAG: ATP-binding protein [Patescibacteria group bacterium]